MRNIFFTIALLLTSSLSFGSTVDTNKELVVNFYNEVLFQGKHQAIDKYIGDKYIQHNPYVADGKEALRNLIKEMAPDNNSPVEPFGEIIRVVAEGDLVVLHIRNFSWPDQNGSAVVDIFRVENNKIVEHWDVVQPVPEKSANNNTMF